MKITEDRLSQNAENAENTLQSLQIEENCPSCLELLPLKASECPSCHVHVDNFKRVALEKRLKSTIGGLGHLSSRECEDLDQAWKKVMAVYMDTEIHHQFLHLCYRYKSMSFAVKKYTERLEKDLLDETADVMRRRAVVLTQESLQERPTIVLDRPELPEVQRSFLRFFNYIMAASLICGVCILLISGLTQNKLFFFGLGLFLCLTSVMTLLFVKRELV